MDTIVTPVTVVTLDSTKITHNIKADLVARYFPPVVRLVQYDMSLPVIAVSLMQNGQTYTLPSGAAANIRVHKPDATYVYNPALGCDSTRNIVYFEVTQAMAAANGDGLAIVEIVVDGDIAGTSLITLHFEENPVPEDAIESSDEWETIYELGERIIASTVTPVSTAAGMTDHNVVYLYTGTESGWNQGHMYYYNGTTWVDAGIAVTDTTLSVAGLAADAKKTGDEIADLKDGLTAVESDVTDLKEDLLSAFATDTASGSIASFPDGADNVPVKSLTVNIEPVQSGSGDPSPDNVRPISGHTSAVVTRTGKNLLPMTIERLKALNQSGTWTGNTYVMFNVVHEVLTDDYGNVTGINVSGSPSNNYRTLFYIILNTAVPIGVMNGCPSGGSSSTYELLCVYSSTTAHDYGSGVNIVGTDNSSYVGIIVRPGYSGEKVLFKPMIRLASDTDPTFEPYQCDTYTVDLDGTVYSGKLDVTKGELVIDSQYTPLPTIRGTGLYNGVRRFYSYNDVCYGILACDSLIVSDEYEYKKVGYISAPQDDHNIVVTPSWAQEVTTVAEFNELLASHPINLVSKLATPITYTLTPTEIRTLLGKNNVWNDCGDTDVEYRADTALYIKKLTGSTEDDMVADANIVSGQYFMVGNTLYKATANIASGGAITPNVNCTRKSLPEALNEINA